MKKIILLIFVLILSIQSVSAAGNLTDTVPNLIKLGADAVIRGIGDNFYSLAGANSTDDKSALMTSLIISSNEQFINNGSCTDNSLTYVTLFCLGNLGSRTVI